MFKSFIKGFLKFFDKDRFIVTRGYKDGEDPLNLFTRLAPLVNSLTYDQKLKVCYVATNDCKPSSGFSDGVGRHKYLKCCGDYAYNVYVFAPCCNSSKCTARTLCYQLHYCSICERLGKSDDGWVPVWSKIY